MKRPFGFLAAKAVADFALLLLEPVRSADPATNSIGIAAAITSIAASEDFRVAAVSGFSNSAFLCAFNSFASPIAGAIAVWSWASINSAAQPADLKRFT